MWFGYNPQIIKVTFYPNIVCHGQSWFMEKPFCLPWAVMASKAEWFLLPWTVMVGRKSDFVCCGKLSLVEELLCLPMTAMFGRAKDLGWH